MTTQEAPSQVYRVFIKTTPEKIWEAITRPGFTERYFHGARITVVPDRYLSLGPNDEIYSDEDVLEFDPPHRLVHGWHSLYDDELAAEETSRVTWEIEPQDGGIVLLTVVHDQLEGAPKTAASVAGPGWMYVLSGLKTLLETGASLGA
jgi:uncharacterized protein YndB with AHSA1/START domain